MEVLTIQQERLLTFVWLPILTLFDLPFILNRLRREKEQVCPSSEREIDFRSVHEDGEGPPR